MNHFLLTAVAVGWSSVALALPNAELERAVRLNDELRYPEAAKALDAALLLPGNDKATLIQIYQLQGVLFATLNQTPEAIRRFRMLLTLAPDIKLKGDHPPRVTTAFFEARGAMKDQGLMLSRLAADMKDGTPRSVSVRVTGDPLKIVRALRFHVRGDSIEWKTSAVLVVNGTAGVETSGNTVEWWVEALDERDVVLAGLAGASNPLVERAVERPPVLAESPLPGPTTLRRPMASTPSMSTLRIAGLVSWAASAGLLVGSLIGYAGYADAAGRFSAGVKQVDENGVVVGLTQVEAYELERSAKFNQTLAIGLAAGAAGAAALGAVLFFLGAPEAGPSVALFASPDGAAVSLSWALP